MSEPAKVKLVESSEDFEDFYNAKDVSDIEPGNNDNDHDKNWVSVAEAATILDITERTIWRRIKKGKLESKQIDGRTYVTVNRQNDSVTGRDSNNDTDSDVSMTEAEKKTDNNADMSDSLSVMVSLVDKLTNQLTAASVRLGYLESEKAKSETQIKLLEDKQAIAEQNSKELNEIQYHYEKLEEEKYSLEKDNLEIKQRLHHYEELQKRSAWKKFVDFMMGR